MILSKYSYYQPIDMLQLLSGQLFFYLAIMIHQGLVLDKDLKCNGFKISDLMCSPPIWNLGSKNATTYS